MMKPDQETSDVVIESDRAYAAKEGLEICEGCGWYESKFSHRCRPDLGRIASALAREVARVAPGVTATKLGYGERMLTFELDDDTHVRFEIGFDCTIRLREVHALGDFEIESAAQLVRVLLEALGKRP